MNTNPATPQPAKPGIKFVQLSQVRMTTSEMIAPIKAVRNSEQTLKTQHTSALASKQQQPAFWLAVTLFRPEFPSLIRNAQGQWQLANKDKTAELQLLVDNLKAIHQPIDRLNYLVKQQLITERELSPQEEQLLGLETISSSELAALTAPKPDRLNQPVLWRVFQSLTPSAGDADYDCEQGRWSASSQIKQHPSHLAVFNQINEGRIGKINTLLNHLVQKGLITEEQRWQHWQVNSMYNLGSIGIYEQGQGDGQVSAPLPIEQQHDEQHARMSNQCQQADSPASQSKLKELEYNQQLELMQRRIHFADQPAARQQLAKVSAPIFTGSPVKPALRPSLATTDTAQRAAVKRHRVRVDLSRNRLLVFDPEQSLGATDEQAAKNDAN